MTTQATAKSIPAVKVADEHHPEKLSDLLERLARDMGDRITIRELAEVLEDRSFGAFLLIFALPNLIPLPPGTTFFLGLPMAMVAWQMVIGYQKIWLPKKLADYTIERATFVAMTTKMSPWLRRAELWVKPRNWPITRPIHERLFGVFNLILAAICVLPIPLGNWPTSFAVAVMGLAHVERDGRCLVAGIVAGIIAILIAATVVLTAVLLVVAIF